MPADETQYKPGDSESVILRKILGTVQGGSLSNPFVVGAELVDPAALPANGTAGSLQRLLANLKGVLLVQQADLSHVTDSVTVWPSNSGSLVASPALAASLVLKSLPGKLMMFHVTNTKSSMQFVQLHNVTSLPGNGAVPMFCVAVPGTTTALGLGPPNYTLVLPATCGMDFSTGIVVANSSTAATLTIGSNDCYFTGVVI